MESKPDSTDLLTCLGLATCAGLLSSAANNIVAYSHAKPQRKVGDVSIEGDQGNEVEKGKCFNILLLICNVLLNIANVLCFLAASKYGPVALAMPILTAANLLSNMIFQFSMEIAEYDKAKRLGTWILVLAVVCLISAGPTNPNGPIDVIELLSTKLAKIWLECLVLTLVAAMVALNFVGQELWQMFLLSVIVAVSTALAASIGKALSLLHGFLFWCCFGGYVGLGVVSFAFGAKAAFKCDMSIYLPVSQCLQLITNCFTGLFIWNDGPRIQDKLTYAVVYVLIVMGVYLCSSYDYYAKTKRAFVPVLLRGKGAFDGTHNLVLNQLLTPWLSEVGKDELKVGVDAQKAGRLFSKSLAHGWVHVNSKGMEAICGKLVEELMKRGALPSEVYTLLEELDTAALLGKDRTARALSDHETVTATMPLLSLMSEADATAIRRS